MPKPKSFRTFEVESTIDYLPKEKLVEALSHDGIVKYAYILHDKDNAAPHFHCLVWLSDSRKISTLSNWFGVQESQFQNIKSEVGAMVYLTHGNHPEKYQYSSDEIVANFDIEKAIADEKSVITVSKGRKASIIDAVANGEIRGYNLHEYLSPQEYVQCKIAIDNAFKYRQGVLMGSDNVSNVRVIWCYGEAGTGKTSWAKFMAKSLHLSYFVSGSGSDFLDGYNGQDCLILDDVRPENIGSGTLLKLLDPNTRSTVKSRYANKWLEVKYIIVTCPISASDFWDKKDCHIDGDKEQLLRRLYSENYFYCDDDGKYKFKCRTFYSNGQPKNWSISSKNAAMTEFIQQELYGQSSDNVMNEFMSVASN